MIILLHSSKTMRSVGQSNVAKQQPQLLDNAELLATYLKTLTAQQLQTCMHLSENLSHKTQQIIHEWTIQSDRQTTAIDCFLGDIYSGLQVATWTNQDRTYANQHLRILSGLYGILRPLDSIMPYRLELGYHLPKKQFSNLYSFWGDSIVATLPTSGMMVNLSSVEYGRVVLPFINAKQVITPTFLTMHLKSGEPTFVAVHAKIARGAYARWLIQARVKDTSQLNQFSDLGYRYDSVRSEAGKPVYLCRQFGGLGLSVRLS